ncbi:hypothetical protein J437_LFUL012139 [Ladona fulva]|uniref:Uncharacterized protein n=1 Tax=Ladona fulva TaxID=123851 RepID=A0A8K0P1C4_LADFU|nr:hypothetical protein J437_LFUL012139 [Ladona fulva]
MERYQDWNCEHTDLVDELIDFMEEKEIEILGLSETKCCGGGEKVLRLGYRLIWGGGREKKIGVDVIISERMWGMVVEVVRVNDRILKLRLGDKYQNILQEYTPQTGCKEEKIEDFLEILDN